MYGSSLNEDYAIGDLRLDAVISIRSNHDMTWIAFAAAWLTMFVHT